MVAAGVVSTATAQCGDVIENAIIDFTTPPGFTFAELFGSSAALDGDRALIGAPYDEDEGLQLQLPGFAEIHERQGGGWSLIAQLSSGESGDDGFGQSVALSGDLAIVGVPRFSVVGAENAGRVNVYHRNPGSDQWDLVATIDNPFPGANERFGSSLAMTVDSGTGEILLVVGVPRDGLGGQGSAQVYRATAADGSSWAPVLELTASDGAPDDRLGTAVAMFGDQIVIGSPLFDGADIDSGAAYVFERSGSMQNDWIETTRLDTPTPAADAQNVYFGSAVAIDGSVVAVGEPGFQACGGGQNLPLNDGKVVTFRDINTTWTLDAEILPAECLNGTGFGASLQLTNNLLAVGAPGFAGAAYVFGDANGVWPEIRRFLGSSPQSTENIGSAVALSLSPTTGEWQLLSGAQGHESGAIPYENGRSYVVDFETFDCNDDGIFDCAQMVDCNENGILDECDITSGLSSDCDENGIPDECFGLDCDQNGIVDILQLCDGSAVDCNMNLILDECEVNPDYEVIFVFDGSASSEGGDLALQKAGFAACLIGPDAVIPYDGTVAVTAVVFASTAAFVWEPEPGVTEPRVVITNAADAARINDWVQALTIGTASNMAGGLDLARQQLLAPGAYFRGSVMVASNGELADDADSLIAAEQIRVLWPGARIAVAQLDSCPPIEPVMTGVANSDETGLGSRGLFECVDSAEQYRELFRRLLVVDSHCGESGVPNDCSGEDADCNCNGVADCVELAFDPSLDPDGDGILDVCQISCPGDVNGDFEVGFADLIILLAEWGPCGGTCTADIDLNGVVGFSDLIQLLGNWGRCACSIPGAAPQSVVDCIQKVGLDDPEKLQACIEAMILSGTP